MSLKRKAATAAIETISSVSSSSNNAAKKPKANASITSFFGAPKVTAASKAVVFDKEKWIEGLTAEQKELLKLEIDTLDESWLAHLKDELVTGEFLGLKRFLKQEQQAKKTVYPPEKDIYSWSRHTPLDKVKVVILGQDPYHNANQAHGLCFSVRPPTPAPPSLQNIYKEIKKDYPDFTPPPNKGGLLTPWADRGVLLLNSCLTVRAHEASSHSNKGWETLTQKVIDLVNKKRTTGVVFMAWGAHARKRVAGVAKDKHCILQCAHPSPLSAANGFFGSQHFKLANDWLKSRYGEEGQISWDLEDADKAGV